MQAARHREGQLGLCWGSDGQGRPQEWLLAGETLFYVERGQKEHRVLGELRAGPYASESSKNGKGRE